MKIIRINLSVSCCFDLQSLCREKVIKEINLHESIWTTVEGQWQSVCTDSVVLFLPYVSSVLVQATYCSKTRTEIQLIDFLKDFRLINTAASRLGSLLSIQLSRLSFQPVIRIAEQKK